MIQYVDAGALRIAYLESGTPDGWPIVLLHGDMTGAVAPHVWSRHSGRSGYAAWFPTTAITFRILLKHLSPTSRRANTRSGISIIFDNPDFVDVVIHSYRHRFGLVAGDPALEEIERRLATQPNITVPTVTLDGSTDGIRPGGTAEHAAHFAGWHQHLVVENAGHNLPQEAPGAFAQAVLRVKAG